LLACQPFRNFLPTRGRNSGSARFGIDMSGRRPVIKGYFVVCV
jgi:hypothetical protein